MRRRAHEGLEAARAKLGRIPPPPSGDGRFELDELVGGARWHAARPACLRQLKGFSVGATVLLHQVRLTAEQLRQELEGDGLEGNVVFLSIKAAFESFCEDLAKGLPAFYVNGRLISAYRKDTPGVTTPDDGFELDVSAVGVPGEDAAGRANLQRLLMDTQLDTSLHRDTVAAMSDAQREALLKARDALATNGFPSSFKYVEDVTELLETCRCGAGARKVFAVLEQ
jgi:hypothetical protein